MYTVNTFNNMPRGRPKKKIEEIPNEEMLEQEVIKAFSGCEKCHKPLPDGYIIFNGKKVCSPGCAC